MTFESYGKDDISLSTQCQMLCLCHIGALAFSQCPSDQRTTIKDEDDKRARARLSISKPSRRRDIVLASPRQDVDVSHQVLRRSKWDVLYRYRQLRVVRNRKGS